jgi:hypothetical protein
MPSVRFEPTILASERAKTVLALDRSATVTGLSNSRLEKITQQGDSKFVLFTEYYGDEIEDDEIDGRGKQQDEKLIHNFWAENLNNSED